MKSETTVVCASRNVHKIKEIKDILEKYGMTVISRDEAGLPPDEVEEDGETFEENSLKKAEYIFGLCGEATIADDSGLMVEYLGGAPGVHSARFAGEHCDYDRNNQKLLALLDGVNGEDRSAKFVTVITMIFHDGDRIVARGECLGRIITAPVGENGFGYDPLFVPEGYNRTFAQLGAEEKNEISHRGRALKELERQLSERIG